MALTQPFSGHLCSGRSRHRDQRGRAACDFRKVLLKGKVFSPPVGQGADRAAGAEGAPRRGEDACAEADQAEQAEASAGSWAPSSTPALDCPPPARKRTVTLSHFRSGFSVMHSGTGPDSGKAFSSRSQEAVLRHTAGSDVQVTVPLCPGEGRHHDAFSVSVNLVADKWHLSLFSFAFLAHSGGSKWVGVPWRGVREGREMGSDC